MHRHLKGGTVHDGRRQYGLRHVRKLRLFGELARRRDQKQPLLRHRPAHLDLLQTAKQGPHPGIGIDAEDNVPTIIKVTGGWEIYGNYVAGARVGIWLQNNSNAAIPQSNNLIHDNILVDNERNLWIHQSTSSWSGNYIYHNKSFIFDKTAQGLVHIFGSDKPAGVVWDSPEGGVGNFFNHHGRIEPIQPIDQSTCTARTAPAGDLAAARCAQIVRPPVFARLSAVAATGPAPAIGCHPTLEHHVIATRGSSWGRR